LTVSLDEPCALTDQLLDSIEAHNNSVAERVLNDPNPDNEPLLKMTDELRLARYLRSQRFQAGSLTLLYFTGNWYEFVGGWRRLDEQAFQNWLYRTCKKYLMTETAKLLAVDPKAKVPAFGKAMANNVEMALRSLLSVDFDVPGWVDGRTGRYLAFRDRLLNLEAFIEGRVELIDQTPAYFSPNSLSYDCEYTDAEPTVLLGMLREQFTQSEIDCLQEWFGYGMTAETDIQRGVYMLGPPRSGKGTIERTERATVGEANCASKTLKAFNSPHALEDLPGKTFLCISDQRSNDRVSAEALERLLGIIGQDVQSINPKGKPHYSAALNCKVMIVSNVMLDFEDDTGAALSRFLFLETKKSYAGKEDPTLLKRILEQRNEVTWWALRGLQRLLRSGRYTEPENNLRQRFQYANSPVRCFVDERCDLEGEIDKQVLYDAFIAWCDERQVTEVESNIFFRRLYASYKSLTSKKAKDGNARTYKVRGITLRAA
jgi:putative DNA primase/helicase